MSDNNSESIKIRPISVEMARNRLQQVKNILEQIQPILNRYKRENRKLSNLSKTGKPQEIAKQRFEVDQLEDQLHKIRHDLLDLDCIIKDFETGLVDFIAIRNGEKVWLCFKRGEEELKYYHGWNAGFVGRQLIDFE